jgi:hypothetical protein
VVSLYECATHGAIVARLPGAPLPTCRTCGAGMVTYDGKAGLQQAPGKPRARGSSGAYRAGCPPNEGPAGPKKGLRPPSITTDTPRFHTAAPTPAKEVASA